MNSENIIVEGKEFATYTSWSQKFTVITLLISLFSLFIPFGVLTWIVNNKEIIGEIFEYKTTFEAISFFFNPAILIGISITVMMRRELSMYLIFTYTILTIRSGIFGNIHVFDDHIKTSINSLDISIFICVFVFMMKLRRSKLLISTKLTSLISSQIDQKLLKLFKTGYDASEYSLTSRPFMVVFILMYGITNFISMLLSVNYIIQTDDLPSFVVIDNILSSLIITLFLIAGVLLYRNMKYPILFLSISLLFAIIKELNMHYWHNFMNITWMIIFIVYVFRKRKNSGLTTVVTDAAVIS